MKQLIICGLEGLHFNYTALENTIDKNAEQPDAETVSEKIDQVKESAVPLLGPLQKIPQECLMIGVRKSVKETDNSTWRSSTGEV